MLYLVYNCERPFPTGQWKKKVENKKNTKNLWYTCTSWVGLTIWHEYFSFDGTRNLHSKQSSLWQMQWLELKECIKMLTYCDHHHIWAPPSTGVLKLVHHGYLAWGPELSGPTKFLLRFLKGTLPAIHHTGDMPAGLLRNQSHLDSKSRYNQNCE